MNIEPIISFHQVPHSDALESLIRGHFAHLDSLTEHLVSCRAVVEAPHHDSQGNPINYRVRLEIGVPGKHLIAQCEPNDNDRLDAYEAVEQAFEKAQRQLTDHDNKLRAGRHPNKVQHAELAHGSIVTLVDEVSHRHGFIEDTEGRQLYFHENALAEGTFEELEEGMDVRFFEHGSAGSPEPTISTLHVDFDDELGG